MSKLRCVCLDLNGSRDKKGQAARVACHVQPGSWGSAVDGMVKPPKLGPNLGRSGVLGARDPPGSAPRVPAPEGVVLSASSTGDSHHSGDTPEDGKAASGARQPAARGSQRRDVSTNTIPSETKNRTASIRAGFIHLCWIVTFSWVGHQHF